MNHKRQKSKLKAFVKEADEVPQMFLIQSVERKLKAIYGKLYDNGVKPNAATGAQSGADSSRKQELIQQLEKLEAAYADKRISLRDYSDKLQQLHLKTIDL